MTIGANLCFVTIGSVRTSAIKAEGVIGQKGCSGNYHIFNII